MILTATQVRDFHVDGYLAITTPVVDEDELVAMRGMYDRLFAQRAGRAEGNQFDLAGADEEGQPAAIPQILGPDRYEPGLRGRYLQTLQSIARQLLGDTAEVRIGHAILKPGGSAKPTPWHQDEAYWKPGGRYGALSFWLPLQPATRENGCKWFVPGSHDLDVLPHQSIGGDRRVHGLELVDDSQVANPVCCPLPAGGVTLHRTRTLHYTGPNVTTEPRRALILDAVVPGREPVGRHSHAWNEAKQTQRALRAEQSTSR